MTRRMDQRGREDLDATEDDQILLLAINCPACRHDLRGSPGPRCPECGARFDRQVLLWNSHGVAAGVPGHGAFLQWGQIDWRIADIDRIDEKDFAVRCSACRGPLSGGDERLTCGNCGQLHARRRLLYDQHGPRPFHSFQRPGPVMAPDEIVQTPSGPATPMADPEGPLLPLVCEGCGYDLRASPGPVCPECGQPFDRAERLWEEHGIPPPARPADPWGEVDWRDADVSRIDARRFPVACPNCEAPLSGPDETLICDGCRELASRRRLLWEQHGPEAFRMPVNGALPQETDVPRRPPITVKALSCIFLAIAVVHAVASGAEKMTLTLAAVLLAAATCAVVFWALG